MTDAHAHDSFCIKEVDGIDRFQQPVSVGIPFADKGPFLPSGIVDDSGKEYPCQCEILSRWSSGSPRWVLITACVDLAANTSHRFRLSNQPAASEPQGHSCELVIDSETPELLSLQASDSGGFPSVQAELSVVRQDGGPLPPKVQHQSQHADGPIYRTVNVSGILGTRRPIRFVIHATHFKAAGVMKLELTLHNPRRAEHPGGFWDLGDPQSERLESVTLSFSSNLAPERTVRWKEQCASPWLQTSSNDWSLHQPNSGGGQWQSRVHLNAEGRGLSGTQGYECLVDGRTTSGLRATPTVQLNGAIGCIEATMVDFWQKFPSAMEVDGSAIKLHLYPKQADRSMELQAGEQTTRTIWLSVCGPETQPREFDWVHHPLVVVPTENRLQETNGLEWFAPIAGGAMAGDFNERRKTVGSDSAMPMAASATDAELLEEMLSGDRNFFWKREQIDEYGWRNYGDFWADHEEAYSDDPKPVISHYNNQYDLLNGLLQQYMRTRDRRWWELARPLANHITDIDIYHTQGDRSVFNGGLFWHTSHYRDAATSTHRTFSRHMTGDKHEVSGGGPSNEHNYTSGLLLYHHLTGCPRARQAVLSLADWVLAMDDGRQSVLAPLSSSPTGKASSTFNEAYHGPGRGVGNSINALVDAWQLTRSTHYLDKCRDLIRRVIHPEEDLDALRLLDAEKRWSYTIALQALARYESVVGAVDGETAHFIRTSLVRYGCWMQENEKPYLENPELLEFPTETWPAQDLRKGTTLMMISAYLESDERDLMYTAGKRLYEDAWSLLLQFPSRSCTRPAAIVLQQVSIRAFANAVYERTAQWAQPPSCAAPTRWPDRPTFRTQKQNIKSNLRSPLGACMIALKAMRPRPWRHTIPETPLGRWLRRHRCR